MNEQLFFLQMKFSDTYYSCIYFKLQESPYINFQCLKYKFLLFIRLFVSKIFEISIFILHKISTQLFFIPRDIWIET